MENFEHSEAEFVLEKRITCTVCDKVFVTKVLKTGKARRLTPDKDLRPRHEYIDTLKYSVCACPNCGYAALHSTFPRLSSRQIEDIKQHISTHFLPQAPTREATYTYDEAIELHERALECCEAKHAKGSESAYLKLLISWLLREQIAQLKQMPDSDLRTQALTTKVEKMKTYYTEACEGLEQAMMNENFPIMGLNQTTLEYILAYMNYKLGKKDRAAKFIGSVLQNRAATRNLKDMTLELKDTIIQEMKAAKK